MRRAVYRSPMLWSVGKRLGFVAVLIALLWLAVWAVLPDAL